jgi:hypothetical protein
MILEPAIVRIEDRLKRLERKVWALWVATLCQFFFLALILASLMMRLP